MRKYWNYQRIQKPLEESHSGGTETWCIDYSKLNEIATFDAFPIPQIDDMLERVRQAQYRSTFNLTKGYWQILIAAEDKEKTATYGGYSSLKGCCSGSMGPRLHFTD